MCDACTAPPDEFVPCSGESVLHLQILPRVVEVLCKVGLGRVGVGLLQVQDVGVDVGDALEGKNAIICNNLCCTELWEVG